MTSDADLRSEVGGWLAEHWRPETDRASFLAQAVDRGYAVPRWPADVFGLDLPDDQARIVEAEFRKAGAPGGGQDRSNLWANTLLTYGTPELREVLLRLLLEYRVRMCLLYSEPGAGSDLAGVRTSAVLAGEDYIVNGQKVWTSSAAEADYGMLIARTDLDVPKHRGISFFFLPMDQPGIQVRPLRQMTGESHFNEVFITDARVPAVNMLGQPGEGWKVLQTALMYERAVLAEANMGASIRSGHHTEVDVIDLARRHGKLDDPLIRQDIARLLCLKAVNRWNNQRAQAEQRQGNSSSVASLGKLLMSTIVHETGRVQTEIVGPEVMLDGEDNPGGDQANFAAMNAYFTSIGGGTDQIQRNIIGERLLGLPKEPEVDKNVPFREVKRSG